MSTSRSIPLTSGRRRFGGWGWRAALLVLALALMGTSSAIHPPLGLLPAADTVRGYLIAVGDALGAAE